MTDETTHDAAAFLTAEQTRAAAKQELRRKRAAEMREILAAADEALRRARASKLLAVKPEPADAWEVLLQNVERRAGCFCLYNANGDLEIRIRSAYLLNTVICIEPSHINKRAQGARLARVTKRLNWTGPKDYRFANGVKAKGYSKVFSK